MWVSGRTCVVCRLRVALLDALRDHVLICMEALLSSYNHEVTIMIWVTWVGGRDTKAMYADRGDYAKPDTLHPKP